MGSRTERILIIDPDSRSRRELDRYLEARGFYVGRHADLASAEASFDGDLPDAIFVDLSPDAIRQLVYRLESEEYMIPIIACGSADNAEEVVEALRAGADDFVIKPYEDKARLDGVLTKLFERARIARLNQVYREELENANVELRNGIAELRADQRAGRKVQMKMLPEPDYAAGGLKIDHLIKPSLYLSGDFFDYFQLDNDRTLVYIADVSGHGASSAFVTVLLRNLTNRLRRNLRRESSDDLMYPDRVLERMNSELLDTGLGKHVTVFVGIFSRSAMTLTYAVGAHFPMPVLAQSKGGCHFLEGRGLPVGLFETPEWNIYTVPLEPSFRLILFSDGILEVIRAKGLEEKEQCLLELISGGRHTIAALRDALSLDDITELPDDIAIVMVTDIETSEN